MSGIRLFVSAPLAEGQPVEIGRDDAHYLFGVMRQAVGATVTLFNGTGGAWEAEITQAGKRGGVLTCRAQTAPQRDPPDLWLLFAPVKKARTDFIVEKAVEMGVRRLVPVATEFTNSERLRQDRLQAHAKEAAEQCGAVFVPEVAELQKLRAVLDGWDSQRRLMFCDEAMAQAGGSSSARAGLFAEAQGSGPWAILIGPEGGFSEGERARLQGMAEAHVASLGPRILRADTAAVAALTLWQMRFGDWQ
ncbi:Ribosomal RNA small subunit methyltransferase E [Roseivivax sp. THAF40]|uniref:16S rRNA (uracil(1498)-N(3))-methyltransferase n=1 Tax=Roseivivax sp. THAF40 TaxID=2587858 RepID=UPI0012685762|nr:16S rRNA (uracil(1498)-N(3))-methyltransferase [Roseivivax sp. THAF40]QFT48282.1 Ribosomal RNA small subunit methyltransferase E [Roseivivax sp. THAF40]